MAKLQEQKEILAPPSRMERFLNAGNVSKKQILLFTQNLAVMLRAGSPLPEALAVLHRHLKGKLKYIIQSVYAQVDRGQKLSVALSPHQKYFSPIYLNMIAVGEYSGRLAENLNQLARQLEKQHALKQKIVSASMYPAIVFTGGVLLSIGIVVFILPNVSELFSNFRVELPLTTRMLLKISAFFEAHGTIAILGTIGVFGGLFFLLRRRFMQPFTHWMILHIPVVKSISRHVNLALFCHITSVLLESGVTIDKTLHICSKSVTNYYYRRFLLEAEEDITGGNSLRPLLEKYPTLFPATDVQIIHIGERSGTLSTSMQYCAAIHEEGLDEVTKNLATMLEPLLLVLIGLMVGFLALSIITPMYSITSSLRS